MTSIDFYFNAASRIDVACRLAGKALARGTRLLVFAPQAEVARELDRMLWTAQAVSFIPHCFAEDALAGETPVLIASGPEPLPEAAGACEVLLNLSPECPPFFERHARLLELVTRDEADRSAGRARYAFYKERGYPIRAHDLAAGAT